MKAILTALFAFFLLASCKQRVLTGTALQNKLIETMHNYLDTTMLPGTRVTVKDVAYYPESSQKLYNCRFHVRVQYRNRDTTGLVVATISNDFKNISRMQ